MNPRLLLLLGLCALPLSGLRAASLAPLPIKPDIFVAADGSGDFKTIQAAVASIPKDNRERRVIFVKDGVYHEKVRVDASFVTIRGQSRANTRLEFPQGQIEFGRTPDNIGRAVLNIEGDDFVLENMVVQNTQGVLNVHAFAIFGRGDRTVLQDCDVLSHGNDTLSLWRTGSGQFSEDANNHTSPNGRYYHARLKLTGSADLICPRGWCYITDSDIFEMNPNSTGAVWHDGGRDKDMKFVLRGCRVDGTKNWTFLRWHHDAQFYVLDTRLSKTMQDRKPFMYPIVQLPTTRTPTAAELARYKDDVDSNVWGRRTYFFNTHRDEGDYDWHQDNLHTAPGAPKPEEITAKWTFAGKWDPEDTTGPSIGGIAVDGDKLTVKFSENVTVKGKPRLALKSGGFAEYASGSGSNLLVFSAPSGARQPTVEKIDLQGGAIVATEAAATLRLASLKLP